MATFGLEKLPTPTQDTRDIIAAAQRLWAYLEDGHRYAKAGVMLNDFTGSGVFAAAAVRRTSSTSSQR